MWLSAGSSRFVTGCFNLYFFGLQARRVCRLFGRVLFSVTRYCCGLMLNSTLKSLVVLLLVSTIAEIVRCRRLKECLVFGVFDVRVGLILNDFKKITLVGLDYFSYFFKSAFKGKKLIIGVGTTMFDNLITFFKTLTELSLINTG